MSRTPIGTDAVTKTPAKGDFITFYDISDSNKPRKATIQDIRQVSGGVVSVTDASVTLDADTHAGKIVVLNRAAGVTVTLPAATATGDVYTIVIGTAATSNANIIQTSATTEHMTGSLRGVDDDVEGATGYQWNAETNDDTVTMNGTSTGGKAGDTIVIRDYESTNFTVDGYITQSGGSEATPFSAAVS